MMIAGYDHLSACHHGAFDELVVVWIVIHDAETPVMATVWDTRRRSYRTTRMWFSEKPKVPRSFWDSSAIVSEQCTCWTT